MYSSLEEIYQAICRDVSKDPRSTANGYCPCHRDKNGSLSVCFNDDRSKILLKCFAGCNVKDIVKELGFALTDLFRDASRPGAPLDTPPLSSGQSKHSHSKSKQKQKKEFRPGVMTVERMSKLKHLPLEFLLKLGLRNESGKSLGQYIAIKYRDAEGNALDLGRKRLYDKASDGMFWKRGCTPTVYGLWYLKRVRELGWCVLVEGESDCWTLWHHKIPALGAPGADMIEKIEADHLIGVRQIWLFIEPDKGGETFRAKVPQRLYDIGWRGELFELTLPGFKDPSDLHVKGGYDEFERVFRAALDSKKHIVWEPPADPEDPTPAYGMAATDLGNAERLVLRFGDRIRWCEEWKRWLVWDGIRWCIDRDCSIQRLATHTVRKIYQELAKCLNGKREEIFKHAKRSENKDRIRAMIELSKSQEGVPIMSEKLDNHAMLLTVKNGVVDLKTGALLPTRPDYYLTRLAPINYDSSATCPTWEKFLHRIMDGDAEMVRFLQRAAGYSLTGLCTERCFFLLWGIGKNGKSTFLETLQALLGDYSLRTPTATLMVQRNAASGAQASPDVARLKGARFVTASETEAGQMLAESKIKDLTGQDTISARHLFGDLFDFVPEFKLWLCTNHKPIIRGTDDAIWDRVKLIPFTVRIPPEEQDKNLGRRLLGELPGILQWAIKGCLDWQKNSMEFPEKVDAAIQEYREEMDLLGDFMEECCALDPTFECNNSELFKAYRRFCEEHSQSVMHHKAFTQRLREKGLQQIRKTKERIWKGIRLLTDNEKNEDFYNFGNDGDRMTRDDTTSQAIKSLSPRIEENSNLLSSPVIVSQEEIQEEPKSIGLNQFRGKIQ